jgi:hypothetical protein
MMRRGRSAKRRRERLDFFFPILSEKEKKPRTRNEHVTKKTYTHTQTSAPLSQALTNTP